MTTTKTPAPCGCFGVRGECKFHAYLPAGHILAKAAYVPAGLEGDLVVYRAAK